MAEFVHCNSCFVTPDQNSSHKFFLTSCAHMFCENCSQRMNGKCKVCGSASRLKEINENLVPEMKEMFMDPVQLLKKHQRRLMESLNFQKSHRARYLSDLQRKLRNGGKKLQELHRENQTLKGENKTLKEEIARLRQGSAFQTPRMTPNAMRSYRSNPIMNDSATTAGRSGISLTSGVSRLSDGPVYPFSATHTRNSFFQSPSSSAQTAFNILDDSNSSGGSPVIPIAATRNPYDCTWRRDISSMQLDSGIQQSQRRLSNTSGMATAFRRGM